MSMALNAILRRQVRAQTFPFCAQLTSQPAQEDRTETDEQSRPPVKSQTPEQSAGQTPPKTGTEKSRILSRTRSTQNTRKSWRRCDSKTRISLAALKKPKTACTRNCSEPENTATGIIGKRSPLDRPVKTAGSGAQQTKAKRLDDIVKLELFADKTASGNYRNLVRVSSQ